MRGVTLLARRLAVRLQDPVDKGHQWPEHWTLALGPLALRRLRISQRLAHHPAVHSQFAGDPIDRPHSKFVFPSNLLK
jgi:hypothetical protein